jgi:uncharacterized protein (TIGR03437 family)
VREASITLVFSDATVRTVRVVSVVTPAAAAATGKAAAGCASSNLRVEFVSPGPEFTAAVGQATSLQARIVDDCGNPLVPDPRAGIAVITRFSNGDPDLNLTHAGNGVWTGTWRPLSGSGRVLVALTALFLQGNVRQVGQSARAGTLGAGSTAPLVFPGALANAATLKSTPVAPGALISLFGANLSERDGPAALPYPEQLNGTEVLLAGRPLPLLFASRGQVNAQVPYGLPSNTQQHVVVRKGNQFSVPESFTVADAQPGIFTLSREGSGQGIVLKSDQSTLAAPATPADRGEVIVIYATGLGAVTPDVPSGTPAPADPARTVNQVTVDIGGQSAEVLFSGLTPGFAGLYQVNAVVPANAPVGDAIPVRLTVAGQSSPEVVTIAIR